MAVQQVLQLCLEQGEASPAGRIYAAGVLNGQLDLTQAESIADLVERDHPKQLKLL